MMHVALVRRPGPRLADGLVTHIERSPIDLAAAARQWDGYVAAMNGAGFTIVTVPAADDCPDAVFIEDAVVVFGDLAVITHPGSPTRRPELTAVPDVVRALGLAVARIESPGTLDGGDVLKVGNTVYVGRSGRTNDAGIEQLRALLGPLGRDVRAVPLTRVLHLKSAVTALPDGTFVGWLPALDPGHPFDGVVAMPEEAGAHVVDLGGGRLLMSAAAPRSAELLASRGHELVLVDITEFERLEGCVTCLSVRVRGPR